jgi:hypothetical protein
MKSGALEGCVLSGEATNTNFTVFVLTLPALENTIYSTIREYARHYSIVAFQQQ